MDSTRIPSKASGKTQRKDHGRRIRAIHRCPTTRIRRPKCCFPHVEGATTKNGSNQEWYPSRKWKGPLFNKRGKRAPSLRRCTWHINALFVRNCCQNLVWLQCFITPTEYSSYELRDLFELPRGILMNGTLHLQGQCAILVILLVCHWPKSIETAADVDKYSQRTSSFW